MVRLNQNQIQKFFLLAALCSAHAFGQEPVRIKEIVRPDSSIKINTSLVLVDGIVLNRKSNTVVGNLQAEDFTILENGQPQKISHFSREELPLSVVLLVDVSGSVQPVIDKIRKTAADALGRLKPADRVALMVFATRAKLMNNLSQDRNEISEGLKDLSGNALEVGDGTLINRGVFEAARYLREQTAPSERRAIILITDDEDFPSGAPSRDEVLKELYETDATLCGIVVSPHKIARRAVDIGATAAIVAVNPIIGGVYLGVKVLRKARAPLSASNFFSANTGGLTVGARNEEIGETFIQMIQLLRTRYTFGYEPPEHPADGKLRLINLNVNEQAQKRYGAIRVLARRGYYYSPKNRS
jgi:VWFA-related protein